MSNVDVLESFQWKSSNPSATNESLLSVWTVVAPALIPFANFETVFWYSDFMTANSQSQAFPDQRGCFCLYLTSWSSCCYNCLKGSGPSIRTVPVPFVKIKMVGIHSADYLYMFYHGDLKNFKSVLIWVVYLVSHGRNASEMIYLPGCVWLCLSACVAPTACNLLQLCLECQLRMQHGGHIRF